jgi:hypothetical protein
MARTAIDGTWLNVEVRLRPRSEFAGAVDLFEPSISLKAAWAGALIRGVRSTVWGELESLEEGRGAAFRGAGCGGSDA